MENVFSFTFVTPTVLTKVRSNGFCYRRNPRGVKRKTEDKGVWIWRERERDAEGLGKEERERVRERKRGE